MSGGLHTVNNSSEVTMINEDGVIAEMIIEVDDDNQLEAHQPFNFDLEDDDDCVEVYSSGFAHCRNNYTGHSSSQNWICNRDVLPGLSGAGEGKEVTPGLCDLNLLGKPGVDRPTVPVMKNVTDSEIVHDCIVVDESDSKRPRRKHGKKLPPPKSSMVTRGKAAANQTSVDVPKEAISDKVAKKDSVDDAVKTTDNNAAKEDKLDAAMKTTKDKTSKEDSLVVVVKTTADKATKEDSFDVAMETSDKDTVNLFSDSSTRQVKSEKHGDSNTLLMDIPKETINKAVTEQVSEDVFKERNGAPKDATESTVLDSGSNIGNSITGSEENIVPVVSSIPNFTESHSEVHKMSSSASKVKEVSFINHSLDEDKSIAEQENISGCGEKLGDIPFIRQVVQNTTRRLGLQALYKLIYGFRVPKDMEVVKERVLQFSGFFFEENSADFERKMRALKMFPDVVRKQICSILGIELSHKIETNSKILEFLLKPMKCKNSQFMVACYQPFVRLERLPAELLKYQTFEGNLIQMVMHGTRERVLKKCRKRKSVVENSEVRLTRRAKRLMEHNEEEKAEEVEKSIASPSNGASQQKSRKFRKDEKKFHEREVPVKSPSDGNNVKSYIDESNNEAQNDGSNVKSQADESNVKSQADESNVKSPGDGSNVKAQNKGRINVKKRNLSDAVLQESSETETDDCTDENVNRALPDSSDGEAASAKGTLGRRLGDFWQIRQNVEKSGKESLQTLHTILYDNYNNYDKPAIWKKNILRFSGFNFKCVSSKWRRKEFILSLMPPSKLKLIADMLHLQYYSSRSLKPLVLNIMKFLSEPRDGMLKHSNFLQKRRIRRKLFNNARKQDKQASLDEENTALEVEALLQDIRKKRNSALLEDSSADSELPNQNLSRRSKKKKLGNIPNVQFMIITSNYEDIDNLHQLLFLQSGPKAKIRRNVQNFDGFTFGPGSFSYSIRIKLLNKMGYEVAKRIAFFLGLTSLGTTIPQQDLNDLIMHFLMCPSDIKSPSKSPSFPLVLAKELPIFHSAVSAGKSIKAYPKNFFNNNPTERPVVDITSIKDAMKSTMKVEKKLAKERKHKEQHEEMKTECETSGLKSDILEDGPKKIIKAEKNVLQNDLSESHMSENEIGTDASVSVRCEKTEEKNDDIVQKVKTWMQNQENSEVPPLVSRMGRKRKCARRKLNVLGIVKRKRTTLRKEVKNTGQSEVEDVPKKQFLFRFDPNDKFDSTKILEYLNRESQKSVVKEVKVDKSEVAEPVQTVVSNSPLKTTVKSELPGSPKVISILLPPPSQSSQKKVPVCSDLNNETKSSISVTDCATSIQNVPTSSASVPTVLEGKLPMPPLPKKQIISLTPQSLQNIQSKVSSTNVTQIKVPSNLLESMKGSQIEGVVRLPQNFVIGQNNSVQASSSGTATNNVLYLPEVQRCLQQINNANGKKKQVQMIKIPANNSVAFQPSSLNMSGGKVYIIPVKPGSQQFSSLPVSSVVKPVQLNSHIVVPSSAESGTAVNIPQLIQVAKNYSRTAAVPVNSVTIAKVKPDFVGPISFPTVSAGQCVFPVSVAPNSSLVSVPVLKVQNTTGKEPNSASEPLLVERTEKVDAEKPKENGSSVQQKEDTDSDSELDEKPLSHLVGHPSDEMLLQNVREIVIGADLASITMRNVQQKVFDKYPQFDLTYRKSFLKATVKKVICSAPPSRIA